MNDAYLSFRLLLIRSYLRSLTVRYDRRMSIQPVSMVTIWLSELLHMKLEAMTCTV